MMNLVLTNLKTIYLNLIMTIKVLSKFHVREKSQFLLINNNLFNQRFKEIHFSLKLKPLVRCK